jgi:hypothetical protein
MRFLLLSTDYTDFLHWLYAQNRGLERRPYAEQVRARADSLFSLADFCSSNLRKLGHEAWDVDANNESMQKAWAREHDVRVPRGRWTFRLRKGLVPWISRADASWYYGILAAQIQRYKPDVLINYATELNGDFLRAMKPYVRLMVGSFASPLPKGFSVAVYDLVLSVVDNFVDYFRRQGVRSERLRFGFEPTILERLSGSKRSIPVSFVGNLHNVHASRRDWLEHVCRETPVEVWSPCLPGFADTSAVKRSHRGCAWGVEMYEILRTSQITLNHHIDVAEGYAGNIRLFESTGAGALLITDWKKNLAEMFEPGKEVVAYRNHAECVDMIRYYMEHGQERAAIARAGQQRTLRDHNYYNRMGELVDIVAGYV